MPTVAVDAIDLHALIGSVLGLDVFDIDKFETALEELCFKFGLEYDGRETDTGRTKLRIEVAASRYDLLSLDGIADALLCFLDPAKHAPPRFEWTVAPRDDCRIVVSPAVAPIRPFVIGAIFRNCKFTEESFARFIELQTKLHHNLCRRRTLVAIGTHNLDVLQGPFTYDALPKKGGFSFVPLGKTEEVDAEGMFAAFETSAHIKPYLPIIRDFDLTPVIRDAKGHVLSVPPIINSEWSKMSATTRNMFVDITATDIRKAEIVLDVITSFMAKKMDQPYTVEPVRVDYQQGHPGVPRRRGEGESVVFHTITPTLKEEIFLVKIDYVRRLLGLPELSADQIRQLLPQMMLSATLKSDSLLQVRVPITRRDILHPCDIAEDIAIAYGYDNIHCKSERLVTLRPINNLSERVRRCLAQAGWRECLTFGLISSSECFQDLRRKGLDKPPMNASQDFFPLEICAAYVSEPKSREFECVRPTLIPGLLRTLSSNQHVELPIRIFEIGDCVVQCADADNGVKQRRHVAALVAENGRSGLEECHGLLDHVLERLKLSAVYSSTKKTTTMYKLEESQEPVFLPGRGVLVKVFKESTDEVKILGIMGVVHPEVLQRYNIPFPCSLFEFSLEPFVQEGWLQHTDFSAP